MKVAKKRNRITGKTEPTVSSLLEVVSFCDKVLQMEEEEGKSLTVITATDIYSLL